MNIDAPDFNMEDIYNLHFMNDQGQYHYAYELPEHEAIQVAFRYKDVTPEVRVTDVLDRFSMHTKQGRVLYSTLPEKAQEELSINLAEPITPTRGEKGLDIMLSNYESIKNAEQTIDPETSDVKIDKEALKAEIKAAEMAVLAFAARESLNLYETDFKPSGLADEYSKQLNQELEKSQDRDLDIGMEI